MRGPRRRRRLAAAPLNELSSEEDTGDSSSEYEPEASIEEQVPNDMNHVSANGTSDNRNPNIVSNIMQPDSFSTSSSNSSDLEEGRIAASAAPPAEPHPGPSQAENQEERDLSQEEVDKLVQLQDLTGIAFIWPSIVIPPTTTWYTYIISPAIFWVDLMSILGNYPNMQSYLPYIRICL